MVMMMIMMVMIRSFLVNNGLSELFHNIFISGTMKISKLVAKFTILLLLLFFFSPVTGLEWPRGFQKVKVPRLRDNGTGWW